MPRDGHVSVFFGLGPRGDITESMLRERIEEICPVTDFRMRERFAFVDCTPADADNIVRKLNGMKFNSSTLTCQISKRDDPARRRNDRNDRRRDNHGRRDRDRDDSRDRVRRRRDDSREYRRRDDSRDRRRRDDSRDRIRRRDDSRDRRRRDDSRDRRRRDDSRDRRRDDSRDRRRDRDDSRDKRRRREDSRDRTESVVETTHTTLETVVGGGGYTYGQSYADENNNNSNIADITTSYQIQQGDEGGRSPRSVESPRSAGSARSGSSPRRDE